MITKKTFNYLLLTILFVSIFPIISFGQGAPSNNFLEISLAPQNPEPRQNIIATLASPYYNLDLSKVSWSINGVVKQTGIGLRSFNFQAGKGGVAMTVKATVNTADDIQEANIAFIPSVVDIIYESLSYTPPFYKGRALNPNQGVVIVTAIAELIKPSGEKISTTNIIYSWKRNDRAEQANSGLGKNTIVFEGSVPIRDTLIEVTASSIDGTLRASKSINISNGNPKIVFYENNALYGIMFNKAIRNTVLMLTDEFSVLAVPYYFSVGYATTPDLDYAWTMNGQTVSNQDPKNSFTTRLETPGAGSANIGLKISNNNRIFQFISGGYGINFQNN